MNSFAQLVQVETDLRNLSVEAKQLFPEIKQTAERAILYLKSLSKHPNDDISIINILKSEHILRPFLSSCSTKNQKLILISLSSIQRLLYLEAIESRSYGAVIGILRILAENNNENLQLKTLQTLNIVLSPPHFSNIIESHLSQALSICFRLHLSSYSVIQQTSIASLRQLLTLLYDEAKVQLNSLDQELYTAEISSLPSALSSGWLVFRDLCWLMNNESASFISVTHLNTLDGLDIIDDLITSHLSLFLSHPAYSNLIISHLSPTILRQMKLSAKPDISFSLLLRLVRIVVILINSFHQHLSPLSSLFSLIGLWITSDSIMHQILSISIIKESIFTPKNFFFFYEKYTQNILEIFYSLITSINQHHKPLEIQDITSNLIQSKKMRPLDHLQDSRLPSIYNHLTPASLSLETINNLLYFLSSPDLPLASLSSIFQTLSSPILSLYTSLLDTISLETSVEALLKILTSITCTLNSLKLYELRDTFLNYIISLAKPSQNQFTNKNIQSLRCVCNITSCVAGSLSNSWYPILELFDQINQILQSQINFRMDNELGEELNILISSLSNLWEQTIDYDYEQLSILLSALGTLTLSTLAHYATGDGEPPPVSLSDSLYSDFSKTHFYTFFHLIRILEYNVHRMMDYWEMLIGYIQCIINNPFVSFREFGFHSLHHLIVIVLNRHHPISSNSPSPSIPISTIPLSLSPSPHLHSSHPIIPINTDIPPLSGSDQKIIFKSLCSLYRSKYEDNHRLLLSITFDLLSSSGHVLNEGWGGIVDLLNYSVTSSDVLVLQTSMKCLQLISSDYLDNLMLSHLSQYLVICQKFGQQQYDLNIAFNSINLIWSACDYLFSRHMTRTLTIVQEDQLILEIFQSFKSIAQDSRPDVRHASIKSLMSSLFAIGERMSHKGHTIMHHTLHNILLPLVKYSISCHGTEDTMHNELGVKKESGRPVMMLVHHSRDSTAKQWSETHSLLIRGLSRFINTFMSTISQDSQFEEWWNELMQQYHQAIQENSEEVHISIWHSLNDILTPSNIPLLSEDNINICLQCYFILKENIRLHHIVTKGDISSALQIASHILCQYILSLSQSQSLIEYCTHIVVYDLNNIISHSSVLLPYHKHYFSIITTMFSHIEYLPILIKSLLFCLDFHLDSNKIFPPFFIECLTNLICCFKNSSVLIQKEYFEKILQITFSILLWADLPNHMTLLQKNIEVILTTIPIGLKTIDNKLSEGDSIRIWTLIADVLSYFLYYHPSIATDQQTLLDSLQCEILRMLADHIIPLMDFAPPPLPSRLMSLFYVGLNDSQCHTSVKEASIYFLCQFCQNQSTNQLVVITVNHLLTICQEIIQNYLQDLRKGQSDDSYREQVVFVLTNILSLSLPIDILQSLSSPLPYFTPNTNSPHFLLIHLYPLLVDCIPYANSEVRHLISSCLRLIGNEVGLI